MSSLFLCNPIQITQAELEKITGGSGISPGDLLAASGSAPSDNGVKAKIAAALEAAEKREQRTATINRLIAVGSVSIAFTGLYLSWRASRRRGD